MFVTLYRDRHLEVIDKPPGIPVVPARDGGDSIVGKTGLLVVHRLDTDTSGALVLARSEHGQRVLSAAFQDGRVGKVYAALCTGSLPATSGTCDVPLGEWKRSRVKIGEGKASRTAWELLRQEGERLAVVARPQTGRTHQVRAHLCHLGAPIVGDEAYGGVEAARIHLHAWRIDLPWPERDGTLTIEAPLPAGFELFRA